MRNCIGIDVAKQYFDLHGLKTGQDQRMENSTDGILKCVAICNKIRPELIAMEATGGYELTLAATLQAEGFAVAVVTTPDAFETSQRPQGKSPRPTGWMLVS